MSGLRTKAHSQESIMQGIKESTGVLDIVFVLLGVATAFRIGSGIGESE